MGETEVYRAVFDADADDLIKESNRAQASLKKLSKTFGQIGTQMIKWGGLATAAIGGVIAQSLKAAAAVEEMQSRFRVSFRDMSKDVETWSIEYAALIGRSRFEIMGMAADYKVLLTAFGLQNKAASEASMALTKLTSDWESWHDVPAAEMMSKIKAGLAGMTRPLRDIGVDVSETAIKQDALNAEFAKGTKELTQLEKVKLRLPRILNGIKEAQGDAERTALDLTNQWRALSGALEELNVDLGRVFVDDAKSAVAALAGLVRSTSKLIRENEDAIRTWGKLALQISAIVLALGVAAKSVTVFVAGIASATKIVVVLKAVVVAAGAALAAIGSTVILVGAAIAALGASIYLIVGGIWDWIGAAERERKELERHEEVIRKLTEGYGEDLPEALDTASSSFKAFEVTTEFVLTNVANLTRGYIHEVDLLTEKLENLEEFQHRLSTAASEFAAASKEVLSGLQDIAAPDKALAQYEQALTGIDKLWPEVETGSVEAINSMRDRLLELGGIDVVALAEAWGVPLDEAKDSLAELTAATNEDIQKIARMYSDVNEKIKDETLDRLAVVGEEVAKIGDQMLSMKMEVDISDVTKKLAIVSEQISRVESAVPRGPGIGTPALDRLSTAMSTQRGRSGGNVVNVNAPVNIRHAEPPRATAKAVAQEIRRLNRRTWGGRS